VLHLGNHLSRVSQRLRLLVTKALVDAVDDSTALQLLKVKALESEAIEQVENIQQYGFSSIPPRDSEVVLVEVGGSRDHLLAIASDNSAGRPTGGVEGEVTVWSQYGQSIRQRMDGSLLLQTQNGEIEIKNGKITVRGNLEITGTLTCSGQATFQAAIQATGDIISAALIRGMSLIATMTGVVSLEKHVHSAFNSPPTPGA
jgi:phage baseplate assembly protein V